jgi:solute carrier family 39 (zinc transporter), member 1/2/3
LLSCAASYLWGSLNAQTPGHAVSKLDPQGFDRLGVKANHPDCLHSHAPMPVTKTFAKTLSRRSACSSAAVNADDYDVLFHTGALLIILFVSSSACVIPVLAIRFPVLQIPTSFLFIVRHFGTGVLIATAFVHLLPTAFISLGDPCLSDFWTTDYPAMPGAIALLAILLVTIVEMVFSPGRKLCDGAHGVPSSHTLSSAHDASGGANISNLEGRSTSISREVSRIPREPSGTDMTESEKAQNVKSPVLAEAVDAEASSHLTAPIVLTPEQQHKKAVVQCMLLELGILFHSIFIGMALSVSVGFDFIVLLIAVTFHRMSKKQSMKSDILQTNLTTETFEGLALGSRIASIDWRGKNFQPWLMALAYGCT